MCVLSIIVPVYNSEKYLCECLNSILEQTFTDFEVICVDDGSTDSSLNILREYEKKDGRVIVISQENKGPSASRNAGMKVAKGKYLTFVDSDDYIEKETYDVALSKMDNVDIVVFGVNVFGDVLKERRSLDKKYYKIKYKGYTVLNNKIVRNIDCSTCNKIFRRNTIADNNISFPEGLHYEDAEFYWKYILNCQSAYFIDQHFYNYRRHFNSIMSETFSKCDFALEHLIIWENIYNYLQAFEKLEKHRTLLTELFEDFFYFSYRFSPANNKDMVLNMAHDLAKKYFFYTTTKSKFIQKLLSKDFKRLLEVKLSFWEWIFSLKNSRDSEKGYKQKIICFLGVRFKINLKIKDV